MNNEEKILNLLEKMYVDLQGQMQKGQNSDKLDRISQIVSRKNGPGIGHMRSSFRFIS